MDRAHHSCPGQRDPALRGVATGNRRNFPEDAHANIAQSGARRPGPAQSSSGRPAQGRILAHSARTHVDRSIARALPMVGETSARTASEPRSRPQARTAIAPDACRRRGASPSASNQSLRFRNESHFPLVACVCRRPARPNDHERAGAIRPRAPVTERRPSQPRRSLHFSERALFSWKTCLRECLRAAGAADVGRSGHHADTRTGPGAKHRSESKACASSEQWTSMKAILVIAIHSSVT